MNIQLYQKFGFASLFMFPFLIQAAGCTSFNSTDGISKRDIVPEFACCLTADKTKVFVIAERVLHQFEFQDKGNSIATRTAIAKTPWQGRVTSIGIVPGSDLLTAVVFDVNARSMESKSKRIDDLSGNSMYGFRVQNGAFTHVKVVKDTFFDARLLEVSKLLSITSSEQNFDSFCDVSQCAIFSKWKLNSEGTEIEVSSVNESANIYCSSNSRIRFSSSRALPFLTNDLGIVTGKWEGKEKLSLAPMSLKKLPKLAGYDNAYLKEDFEYSIDVSSDNRFIGSAISFPQHIRFSVWDTYDGELILDSLYDCDGATGPKDSIRCFSLGKMKFCFGQGRFIRIVDAEKKSVQLIDVLELANEYRSSTLLASEIQAGTVEFCVVLEPLDANSVRKIRVPLD